VRVFHHSADLRRPVTSASIELSESEDQSGFPTVDIGSNVDGLVILTQTCDVRRSCSQRPYIEVCPLVYVDEDTASAAAAGEMPRYATLPAVGSNAVADLDRSMTVEKGWLSFATRTPGWATDAEIRHFQAAIARHYQRFAFPDDFTKTLSKLRKKILDRHGKQTSHEGRLFAVVEEIRVSADPSWAADSVEVTLIFILPAGTLAPPPDELIDGPAMEETLKWLSARTRDSTSIAERILSESDPMSASVLWKRLAESWARNCTPSGCISAVYGEAVDAEEFSIAEYKKTDRLDLDHLSDEGSPPETMPPEPTPAEPHTPVGDSIEPTAESPVQNLSLPARIRQVFRAKILRRVWR
jgi:hypothetical protein